MERKAAAARQLERLLRGRAGTGESSGLNQRMGLAGEQTSADTLARLLPTIRNDMTFESDRIRDQNFEHHHRIREIDSVEENTRKLSQFLAIPPDKAHEIAATDYLFAD